MKVVSNAVTAVVCWISIAPRATDALFDWSSFGSYGDSSTSSYSSSSSTSSSVSSSAIKGTLEDAEESLISVRNDLRKEVDELEKWKIQEAARTKRDVETRLFLWAAEKQKIEEDCEGAGLDMLHQCEARMNSGLDQKYTDLEILQKEQKDRLSKGVDAFLQDLAKFELRAKSAKTLLEMKWTTISKTMRLYKVRLYEDDFQRLVDDLNLLCEDIDNEMKKSKAILFANICMTVEGLDDKINPLEEKEFNADFELGVELAFANEGLEIDVHMVKIIDQDLQHKHIRRRLARRKGNRVLRMVVGASFSCGCDDGSSALKGDVVRRQLPWASVQSSASSSSGKESSASASASSSSGTESYASASASSFSGTGTYASAYSSYGVDVVDVAVSSGVNTTSSSNFRETLSESIELAFDNTISVAIVPCSEMDDLVRV